MLLAWLLGLGIIPDALLRWGIRRVCRQRLDEEAALGPARQHAFVEEMARSPVALNTTDANTQHYEVPAAFFQRVLGPHLKYSCGLWADASTTLAQSEEAMLDLTCSRARLADGQSVLELGCGWGSLTLFMARRYPNARFTAVSNSASQKEFIDRAGLPNVTVVTADMNTFSTSERFDRVVSVEMFEHMRNVALLFERISTWLKPGGLLFLHVFNHATFAYPYEDKDPSDWMARHFFTGGMMPSQQLYAGLNQHLRVTEHHQVSGTHYEKTSNAWLRNLDAHHDELWPLMEATYGTQARQFWAFWRVFFLACAELFGLDGGTQWGVGHYVLEPLPPDDKDASLRRS